MIDDKTLAEIEARATAATEGPWETTVGHETQLIRGIHSAAGSVVNFNGLAGVVKGKGQANGVFIASSRTDVPTLVAEVRRLQKALDDIIASEMHEAADPRTGCHGPCPVCIAMTARGKTLPKHTT